MAAQLHHGAASERGSASLNLKRGKVFSCHARLALDMSLPFKPTAPRPSQVFGKVVDFARKQVLLSCLHRYNKLLTRRWLHCAKLHNKSDARAVAEGFPEKIFYQSFAIIAWNKTLKMSLLKFLCVLYVVAAVYCQEFDNVPFAIATESTATDLPFPSSTRESINPPVQLPTLAPNVLTTIKKIINTINNETERQNFIAPVTLSTVSTPKPSTTPKPISLFEGLALEAERLDNSNDSILHNLTQTDEQLASLQETLGTKILLYTRKHPQSGLLLVAGNSSTLTSLVYYKSDVPTRFIIHSSYDGPEAGQWMKEMKNRFFQIEDSNIIIVDWSRGAGSSLVDQRLTNIRMVGAQIARVIEDLMQYHGTKLEDIHIIAHSFGTFAADVVGRKLRGIGRITGLDPAGPNFDALPLDMRLDKSDALFVDVIHTDMHNSTTSPIGPSLYGRGTSLSVGHLDFFPNGGSDQPGCSLQRFEDLITRPIGEGIRRFVACHQYRSIDYFLESITPTSTLCVPLAYECSNYTNFLDGKCASCDEEAGHTCAQMGFRSILVKKLVEGNNKTVDGKAIHKNLYLMTNRRKPFCLYHYHIEVHMAKTPELIRGGVLLLSITGEYGQMEARINGG